MRVETQLKVRQIFLTLLGYRLPAGVHSMQF